MTNQGSNSSDHVRPPVAPNKPTKKPALLLQHKQQLEQQRQLHEPWLFQSIHIAHSPWGATPLPAFPSPSLNASASVPSLASPAPFYLDVESLRTLLPVSSRRPRPRSSDESGSRRLHESYGSPVVRGGRNNQRHLRLEALRPLTREAQPPAADSPQASGAAVRRLHRRRKTRRTRSTSVHRKLALRLDTTKARQSAEVISDMVQKQPVRKHHAPIHRRGFAALDEDAVHVIASSRASSPPLEDLDEARRQKAVIAAQLGLTLDEYEALDAAFGGKSDSDEDGSLTDRYHAVFAQFDIDGSGAISPSELHELLKAAGEDMDDAELATVITQADTDGDGEINFDEFMGLMLARKRLLQVANTMGVGGTGPGAATNVKLSVKTRSSGTSLPSVSSLASPLPPLRLAAAQSKKHLAQSHYTRHYSRPTPNCLRPGATQVDVTQLRRELAIAEFGIQELNAKVRDGVHWVQQHCPVTSLKAQIYCHRWGLEKLQQLLVRLQSQSLSRAYQKWKAFLHYERNKLKANLFLKCKGSQKLTEILRKRTRKTLRRRFAKWHSECAIDARNEVHAAAVELQRIAKGKLARLWRWRERQRLAATKIQSLVRGHLGRHRVEQIRRGQLEHACASILQRCYRGYNGKRLAKALFRAQQDTLAARRIQRAFRHHQKRRLLRAIQRAKLERDCAVQLQCCMRSFLARKELRRRTNHRRRLRSSVVIQRYTRGLLARREYVEKKRRIAAAITIQTQYRAFRSRWQLIKLRSEKADRVQRERERVAATAIQTRWRTTATRREYLFQKLRLREAQQLLAFRRLTGALLIQRLFRGYTARRTAQRLRYEKLKWMNFAAMNRSALRIQACWRGFHGRLASQLRLQAQRAMVQEELQAAKRIQSVARGKLARGERERREAKRVQILAMQRKRTRAAIQIQRIFRGKRARKLAAARKQEHQEQARAALDRLVLQTKTRAAIRIQCCARVYLARSRYRRRKLEVERRKLESASRMRREHAAVVIQCALRRAKARRLLRQRRHEFEKRISIMASEKALDEIERLREEQEAELAKLRVQLLLQESKATQESASLRKQLEEQREEDEQRRDHEAQELARLKLEALMQMQHAQASDRRMLDLQRQQEAERIREQLQKQLHATQEMELLVRTQENEELAKLKMTALLQTTTKTEPARDTEAARLQHEAAQLQRAAQAMQRDQAKLKIQSVCLKYIAKRRIQKLQAQQAEALAQLRSDEERVRVKALQEKEMALAKLKAMMDDEARARDQEIKALEAQMLERARLEKERLTKRDAAARRIQASARGYLGRQRVKVIQKKIEMERVQRAKAMEEQLAAVEAKMAATFDTVDDSGGGADSELEASSLSGNPEDWVEYWDENAQASYYYNIKTQEASWTRPFSATPTTTSSKALEIVMAATTPVVDYDGDPYNQASAASGYAAGGYADEYGFYDQYGQYHYYEEPTGGNTYQAANAAMGTGMMYPGYAAAAAAYAYQAAMAFGGGNPMMFGTAYNPQLVNPMMMPMATMGANATSQPMPVPTTGAELNGYAASSDSAVPPDPWEKFFDQYTGAAYYYNSITGEKYWA